MKNEEKKYIIKYKMNSKRGLKQWNYSTRITNYGTWSVSDPNRNNIITKMILKEARKNVIKIKEIRKKTEQKIVEIQIIDTETNEIIDISQKFTKFNRFEIMDI